MNIYLLVLLCLFLRQGWSVVLVYKTANQPVTQSFDCIYYSGDQTSIFSQSFEYCIRPENSIQLERNFSSRCLNDGMLYTFNQLILLNLSYTDLLSWSSSVDAVDRYQTFLKTRMNEFSSMKTNFICNCTKEGTFGLLCEYELLTKKNSFEATLQYQFTLKSNHRLGSQIYGNITCYKPSFPCDYGLLCLDWRHICDGKQQCIDGTDEDHCERLFFNECQSEIDYQCRNGMCIDQEYFLDGDHGDCFDDSDEQYETPFRFDRCAYQPDILCDERLPRAKNLFVCGDGETIPEDTIIKRHRIRASCESYRDKNYMCELDPYQIMWTNRRTGQCLDWGFEEEVIDCQFFLKCTLTDGLHALCNCTGNDCLQLMKHSCPSSILYSNGSIYHPFVEAYYFLDTHDFEKNHWPDQYQLIKSIKCNGYQALANNESYLLHNDLIKSVRDHTWMPFESLFCQRADRNESGSQYDKHCWKDIYINRTYRCSETPFECISINLVRDMYYDCLSIDDEKTNWYPNCSSIRKHRFQCSQTEVTCLIVWTVGDSMEDCQTNIRDEYLAEQDIQLSSVLCQQSGSYGCQLLRNYIEQSSVLISDNTTSSNSVVVSLGVTTPFWSYCNSIWDRNYGVDEQTESCKQWKCNQDYYQCQTGQCIPIEWLCNNVWDCSDGSDEEKFQEIITLSDHNSQLIANLTEMKMICAKKNSIIAFASQCNISKEYPCLLANVQNALDFQINRPCIKLSQLGDGHVDCYGGLDERNILNCTSKYMQGFSYQCRTNESNRCISNGLLCSSRCLNTDDDQLLCFHLLNSSYSCRQQIEPAYASIKDVQCLNGTCIRNGKCNKKIDCVEFGEDEFYCNTGPTTSTPYIEYRYDARKTKFRYIIELISYPNDDTNVTEQKQETMDTAVATNYGINSSRISERQQLAQIYSREAWICNRGIAIRQHSPSIIDQCFCPPSYYGRFCQYVSDRISIITHLEDLTHILSSTIKILAVFLKNGTTIDHHEFHFTIALNDLKKKHKFYFVHHRPHQLSIDVNYQIRFELYQLNIDSSIEFLAVWLYPIKLTFLPSNRIARILKYRKLIHDHEHICLTNNPCENNGTCYPFLNIPDKKKYWCNCRDQFNGNNCQNPVQSCWMRNSSINHLLLTPFCSSSSICRPYYQHQQALCICSMDYFGSRCFWPRQCNLKERRNPCLNGGICYVNYERQHLRKDYVCICSKNYFGKRCEIQSATLTINYIHNQSHRFLATIIQLFDINENIDLHIKKQLVYKSQLPVYSRIGYEQRLLPMIGLIKTSSVDRESVIRYYLLYSRSIPEQHMSVTLQLNERNTCPHTFDALQLNKSTSDRALFRYPTLCTNNQSLLCFYDDDYICLCDVNSVAQCFLYDRTSDQCQYCLARGQCFQGNHQDRSDFLCLCPRCYFGSICQYNTQLLSFTMECLLTNDLLSSSKLTRMISFSIYIIISLILFFLGLINNLFSLLTFNRPKSRINGVGCYLFAHSILCQLSLFWLSVKISQILISTRSHFILPRTLNTILCKATSFLLPTCSRICFWLTAFVTIERVYVTMYPTNTWLKQPKIARRIILLIILLTFGSHIHDLIYYENVNDPKYLDQRTWCVAKFTTLITIYNQINTVIHYSIPFLINSLCTIMLIILIGSHRARVNKRKTHVQIFREQFIQHRELFIPSITIIASALPQFIISFHFACTELNIAWQRYLFTVAYFLSYLPQILTFLLYVQPSTLYKSEFQLTIIGKFLHRNVNKGKQRI